MWDRKLVAPKNNFRVIGEDTFREPPTPYFIGDCADIKAAEAMAQLELQPMTTVTIYDDTGRTVNVFDGTLSF